MDAMSDKCNDMDILFKVLDLYRPRITGVICMGLVGYVNWPSVADVVSSCH